MLVFRYGPVVGNVVAFRRFVPGGSLLGEEWVGLRYVEMFLADPSFWRAVTNTAVLGLLTLAVCLPVPVAVALLLDQLPWRRVARATFEGVLPTVTVTDTRELDEIDPAAFWSVLGTVGDFVSGSDVISADHLGWAPSLLVDGEGVVGEGDVVGTVLDGDVGLVDQELLFYSSTSADAAPGSPWSANADLTLKTPLDVEPGSYTSTLTLSLFE